MSLFLSILGLSALVLTGAMSVAAAASLQGSRRRLARWGIWAAAATVSMALLVLLGLVLRRDFSIRYVYEHISVSLPSLYLVPALWAGQAGSLLVWLCLAAWVTAILSATARRSADWAAVSVMLLIQAFLALILVAFCRPFETLPAPPADGRGLSPYLQNIWMIIHPPVVLLSYALLSVPFALMVGELAVGGSWPDDLDGRRVWRWALIGWLTLGAGILLGARWAYQELGWGGYWSWDAVENASLLPWLSGAASLHVLSRRSAQTWAAWLACLTWLLCGFAALIARSGIIRSIHAFAHSPVGYSFALLMVACLLTMGWLLWKRRAGPARLSWVDGLLMGMVACILIGTLLPTLGELLVGRRIVLDRMFYALTVGPLALAMVGLLGIYPWRRSVRGWIWPALAVTAIIVGLGLARERNGWAWLIWPLLGGSVASTLISTGSIGALAVGRKWQRWTAHVIHLGLLVMGVGIAGSTLYRQDIVVSLRPGESMLWHGYRLRYDGLSMVESASGQRVVAALEFYSTRRAETDARFVLRPERFWHDGAWGGRAAIRFGLRQDVYAVLSGFEADGQAVLAVSIHPLVSWLWIGGVMVWIGGAAGWLVSGRADV